MPLRLPLPTLALFLLAVPAAAGVRDAALFDLSFDEPAGVAQDRSTGGVGSNDATPVNDPARIPSPFPGRQGNAAVFDPARSQFFRVLDAPDLSQPHGGSVSLWFLSRHAPESDTTVGVLAKRQPNEQGSRTNYGINFSPKSGRLQVYVHDGTKFRVARFPLDQAVGVRRRVHLTATFRHGDAPEPDTDADPDDLEIRLYVNGVPLAAAKETDGLVAGDAAWLIDVDFGKLVSDTPLLIGASYPGKEPDTAAEFTDGVIDEFLLFDRPLSPEEAAALFLEVAGPDGAAVLASDNEPVGAPQPVVTTITPRGLQVGGNTRLTFTGSGLRDADLLLPGVNFVSVRLPDSTAERVVFDVTVPAEASPTVAAVSLRTVGGVSEPLPLAVDRLPERIAEAVNSSPLPAAFTGRLAGVDRPQWEFDGTAGASFVAEVWLRRLGGTADAVLELKNAEQTPVAIAWGSAEFGGDPRLTATLPADGRYTLELHDLAFQASPGPYRLVAGDLRLLDAILPPAFASGAEHPPTAVGVGVMGLPVAVPVDGGPPTAAVSGPAADAAQGPLPVLPVSDGVELTQNPTDGPIELPTDGTPVYLTARLPDATTDAVLTFRGQPGRSVRLSATAVLGSPVVPVLEARAGGSVLGRAAAKPSGEEAAIEFPPPADGLFEVRLGDRLRGTEPNRFYRLRIAPTDRPEWSILADGGAVSLPASGKTLLRLRVMRTGNTGPIRLMTREASGVTVDPSVLPAGKGTDMMFVTLAAAADRSPTGEPFTLTAEIDTPNGPVRQAVRFRVSDAVAAFDPHRPTFAIPLVEAAAVPAVELSDVPSAVSKGQTVPVSVRVTGDIPAGHVVRLSLVSEEPPRKVEPGKPEKGDKPLVRLADGAVVRPGEAGTVTLLVPEDTAVGRIDGVIRAEVVPHAFSDRVTATGYSAPFRLTIAPAP